MSSPEKPKPAETTPKPPAKPKASASRRAGPKPAEPQAPEPQAPEIQAPEIQAAVTPEPQAESGEKTAKKSKKEKEKEKEKEKKKDRKEKKKKKKEAVIIRFDDQQLPQVDAQAEALGLSRAAWVRMVVAKALAKS